MTAARWMRGARAAALLALTVGVAALAARRGGELVAAAALVPPDHPWVRLDREITAEFGFANPVVWVIAARQGTVWNAEHLRRVQDLTAAVLRIPGVVATEVISLASPNLRDLRVTETGLQPAYLMPVLPATPEAMNALRRRVDADPNYRGTLVSLDGRAAMVVANFRPDADARVVGEAARALRAAHRDQRTEVYVAGALLVETMRVPLGRRAIGVVGAALLGAAGVLLLAAGAGALLRCITAGLLAVVWTVAAVTIAGTAQLPWTLFVIPYAAALGAAGALLPRDQLGWRPRALLGAALAGAFGCMALVLGPPARAFATAGAAASLFAMLAAGCCAPAAGSEPAAPMRVSALLAPTLGSGARRWRIGAAALVAGALLGLSHLSTSLGLAGYGQRYLPGEDGRDLRGIARHFPPPTALVLRVRGGPRFVASPAVLRAFDHVVVPLRAEPSVVSAASVADLVKLVHRAFNDDDPAFATIPDDAGLVARYLALAYSPGFRRFVDRSLATAAIWIYARTDDPAQLDRLLARVRAQLAVQPVPGAEVELIGGDGARVLLMAAIQRALATALGVWPVSAALLVALLCGRRAALRAALGGSVAAAMMGGGCAWLGLPLDLVSAPLLAAVAAAGTGLAVLSGYGEAVPWRAFGLALILAAVPGLLSAYAGAQLLGSAGLALGVVAGAFPALPANSYRTATSSGFEPTFLPPSQGKVREGGDAKRSTRCPLPPHPDLPLQGGKELSNAPRYLPTAHEPKRAEECRR
jgi:predicted RND superfamily exporter protein